MPVIFPANRYRHTPMESVVRIASSWVEGTTSPADSADWAELYERFAELRYYISTYWNEPVLSSLHPPMRMSLWRTRLLHVRAPLRCAQCRANMATDETTFVSFRRGVQGGAYHPHCFERLYATCRVCDTVERRDDTDGWGVLGSDGTTVNCCGACINSRRVRYCESCETNVMDGDYDNSRGSCYSCSEERTRSVIADHDARLGTENLDRHTLYSGVEIEVEVTDREYSDVDVAESVRSFAGEDALTKHDGSLSNGIEIVTRPLRMQDQIDFWKRLIGTCSVLRDGCESEETSTCGMHVHLSRAALTTTQLGRMLVFVNNQQHSHFIERVAGRRTNSWCCVQPKRVTYAAKPYHFHQESRYVALNLENRNTVEFRIFKGTLNVGTIARNVEFCYALAEFCSAAHKYSIPLKRWDTSRVSMIGEFITFVTARRKEYPHLWYSMTLWGDVTKRPNDTRSNFKDKLLAIPSSSVVER